MHQLDVERPKGRIRHRIEPRGQALGRVVLRVLHVDRPGAGKPELARVLVRHIALVGARPEHLTCRAPHRDRQPLACSGRVHFPIHQTENATTAVRIGRQVMKGRDEVWRGSPLGRDGAGHEVGEPLIVEVSRHRVDHVHRRGSGGALEVDEGGGRAPLTEDLGEGARRQLTRHLRQCAQGRFDVLRRLARRPGEDGPSQLEESTRRLGAGAAQSAAHHLPQILRAIGERDEVMSDRAMHAASGLPAQVAHEDVREAGLLTAHVIAQHLAEVDFRHLDRRSAGPEPELADAAVGTQVLGPARQQGEQRSPRVGVARPVQRQHSHGVAVQERREVGDAGFGAGGRGPVDEQRIRQHRDPEGSLGRDRARDPHEMIEGGANRWMAGRVHRDRAGRRPAGAGKRRESRLDLGRHRVGGLGLRGRHGLRMQRAPEPQPGARPSATRWERRSGPPGTARARFRAHRGPFP